MDSRGSLVQFDAVEIFVEIEMPPGTAELAIGRQLEADFLLLPDDLLDFAIFHRLQRVGRYVTLRAFGAGFFQRNRSQQAADVVSAKRRFGALGHGCQLPALQDDKRMTSFCPTLRRPIQRSSAAWPTALPRRGRCLPRSRQSRIAARGRADQARRISSLLRSVY